MTPAMTSLAGEETTDRRDAERYRWLRQHARQIITDQQWRVLPAADDEQKTFLDDLIDAELCRTGER